MSGLNNSQGFPQVIGAALPSADGQNIQASPSGVTRYVPTAAVQRLRDLFAPSVCDLAVGLRPNGIDYEFLYGWGGGRYWRCMLAQESGNPGNFPLHQIQDSFEVSPQLSVLGNDASVTIQAGVTGPTANAAAFGGQYWYGTAAANTISCAIPSSTRIGWRGPVATNGAAAVVSIDGDTTAANLLPTAQQMVNMGAYPSSILTGNGGTVSPISRILDTYGATTIFDFQVAIADGLNPGTHTLLLTPVGTARSVGGGTRAYFSGYGYATTPVATTISTPNVTTYSQVGLLSPFQASAWEYALETGGTFMGNVHGYDVEDSIQVFVDGALTSFVTGQISPAQDAVDVIRQSHLVNPANTAQTVARVTTTYHLDRDGLRVSNVINWQASLTIQAAYCMAALNGVAWEQGGHASLYEEVFDNGSLLGYPGGPLQFTGAGDNFFPTNGVKTEAAWMYGGNYGLLMWMPNVSQWVNGWANSTNHVQIEDRNAGGLYITKIYFGRVWSGVGSEAVNPGTTWQSTAVYLMGRFPAGAATVVGGA